MGQSMASGSHTFSVDETAWLHESMSVCVRGGVPLSTTEGLPAKKHTVLRTMENYSTGYVHMRSHVRA